MIFCFTQVILLVLVFPVCLYLNVCVLVILSKCLYLWLYGLQTTFFKGCVLDAVLNICKSKSREKIGKPLVKTNLKKLGCTNPFTLFAT